MLQDEVSHFFLNDRFNHIIIMVYSRKAYSPSTANTYISAHFIIKRNVQMSIKNRVLGRCSTFYSKIRTHRIIWLNIKVPICSYIVLLFYICKSMVVTKECSKHNLYPPTNNASLDTLLIPNNLIITILRDKACFVYIVRKTRSHSIHLHDCQHKPI